MGLLGKPANLGEDLTSFKKEVSAEIASEERMLRNLQTPTSNDKYGHLISAVLIVLMAFLIFRQNSVFILWLIIGILLYSYNYIIFFIPTTVESIRPDDKDVAPILIKERKWFALRLLLKKRKLAIEIGLTIFLGGVLPLFLSFSIIFGLGLFFALYFGFFTHIIAPDTIEFIVAQIILIILYYGMMLVLKPQAQGITKIARKMKEKLAAAKAIGRASYLVLILSLVGVIAVACVLVIGVMILPGLLLSMLWGDLGLYSIIDIPMILLVFAIQLTVMRHFHGIISRRMAIKRLKNRLIDFNHDVLAPLEKLDSMQEGDKKEAVLGDLKSKFYSIAIYDLIEQDIFGYSRIYLFGVRLRYMLDEEVLAHIYVTTEKGSEPKRVISKKIGPEKTGNKQSEKETEMIKTVELGTKELRKMFDNMGATMEKWKVSIEETDQGTRVEIHVKALIVHKKS